MKDLKDKLSKINLWTLVIAIILLICNFIPSSESFKVILLILTSMNTGIIFFCLWLRNLNIGKFANKVNMIYTITIIVAGVLLPFVLMDAFGTTDFGEKWTTILSMSAIVNTTLFLTMSWVKKWIKKID